MRHNKRALSPIIATILLIVITIAAALIIWSMLGTFSRSGATAGVEIISGSAILSPDGRSLVLKVAVKNSGSVLLTGGVSVTFPNGTAVYFKTDGTGFQTTNPNDKLPAGQTIEISAVATLNAASVGNVNSVIIKATYTDPNGKTIQDIKPVAVVQG
jgi:flagellin-like protein